MGTKHICLPFPSEAQYREYVDDPAQYRQYLTQMLRQYPELFPQTMDQGYTFHDAYMSVKQDLIVRRMKLPATGAVFTLRPSFVMPSMIAHTDDNQTAVCAAPAALGRVDADAPQWSRGRDGVEEVSPSSRLHPSL